MTTYELMCELQEFVDEHGEPPICPACESAYGAWLGKLGKLDWFRCVGCGMTFSHGPSAEKLRQIERGKEMALAQVHRLYKPRDKS